LATHTSGLPDIPSNLRPADELNPYADYTVEQMYAALEEYTLPRKPGEVYEYSNWGMGLLGHILALRSGMSYEELVVTRIANELGMPDTRITLTPRMQEHLAQGYRDKVPFPLWDIPTLAGAGALRSTARDMLTYLAANMGLQESNLYPAMQITHQVRRQVNPGKMQIGLGWHIMMMYGGQKIIEHHGGTGGYASYVGFIKEKQTGAVVLTNTYDDFDYIGFELLGIDEVP
jgi:CubicO group peptidase (beta-lactamase class C family)